jgi:uncharacterized protein
MILEGVVTTRNVDGSINVAPMGPIVNESLDHLLLRPFQTSTTFQNLKRTRVGVFHVVDDVLLLARAAIGQLAETPPLHRAERIDGSVLADACRWYEFEVESMDESRERSEIQARVVHMGRLRDFSGFNRAKHAVLEAAILATRLDLIPAGEVEAEMARLRTPVSKTAGPRELEAFSILERYVAEKRSGSSPSGLG